MNNADAEKNRLAVVVGIPIAARPNPKSVLTWKEENADTTIPRATRVSLHPVVGTSRGRTVVRTLRDAMVWRDLHVPERASVMRSPSWIHGASFSRYDVPLCSQFTVGMGFGSVAHGNLWLQRDCRVREHVSVVHGNLL